VRRDFVPFHQVSAVLLHATNFLVQFVATLMLFALMFKVIPGVEVRWRDVWMAASVSSLFFGFGKTAIGFYLARPIHSNLSGPE
jgi:membrane protein